MRHVDFEELSDEEYDVVIDSTLQAGSLTYGELYLPGETSDEVLVSCHVCHPSLCNDNLSGITVAVKIAETMAARSRRYSYRFLSIPGTIGSITWLAQNEQIVTRIRHGLVITGVGDAGNVTYKKSRQGNAEIDRATTHVLRHSGEAHSIIDFFPYGYDERQYCSPGFNLPVGCFMRTPHGQYPEYHSSADNFDLIRSESLSRSYADCLQIFELLEGNRVYVSQNPRCEPQLGRHAAPLRRRAPRRHLVRARALRGARVRRVLCEQSGRPRARAGSGARAFASAHHRNAVVPGWVETDMAEAGLADIARGLGRSIEDVRRDAEAAVPLGRFLAPEEIAATVAFLVGKDAAGITGQAIAVCGGATAFGG